MQFNKSPNCILEDFSVINDPETSWVEDNISIFRSDNCVVRRGLIDGNNSPSGVAIMFEKSTGGLVEDIDALHQGNGSFATYPSWNITWRRVRTKDNICTDQGRGSRTMTCSQRPSSRCTIESSIGWIICS